MKARIAPVGSWHRPRRVSALRTTWSRANPGRRGIHVILDQGGTNRGRPVREWLARPGCRIRPIYLPSYAPNLNAIERLWKVMHQHVTHNRYYEDFRTFAEAIMRFFKTTLPEKWRTIRDTVTDNFHIIRPEKFQGRRVDGV